MERRPHNPEEGESGIEKSARKKHRTPLEVLRGWLHYRNTGSMMPEQAEAASEESGEKKKVKAKRKKLASWILSKLTGDKERAEGEKVGKKESPHILPGVELAGPFSQMVDQEDKYVSESVALSNEEVFVPIRNTEIIARQEEERKEELVLPNAATVHENEVVIPLQEGPEKNYATTEEPLEEKKPEPAFTAKGAVPYPHELPTIPLDTAHQERLQNTPSSKEVERIVERSGATPALAALTAAEYIGRRRADKKLKKSQEATQHQVDKLHKHQDSLQFEVNQQRKSQNAERVPQQPIVKSVEAPFVAPRKQERFERVMNIPVPVPEEVSRMETKPPTMSPEAAKSNPVSQPESLKQILEKQTHERLGVAEKLIATGHYENVKPVAVQKAIEQLAEKNVPLENIYERRHEIRGEEGQDEQAARVGAYTKAPLSQAGPANYQQFVSPSLPQDPTESTPYSRDATYKKAALSGFWTALILLIFLAILLLVR